MTELRIKDTWRVHAALDSYLLVGQVKEEEDCHSSHNCKKVRSSYTNILQDKQKKKNMGFF